MEQCLYSFPVDLTKEEYVAFAYLQGNKYNPKRQRTLSVTMSLLCVALLLGLLIEDWVVRKTVDPLVLGAAVLMLIPAVYTLGILPGLLRRRAEKTYDNAIRAGRTFFGEVRLYPDRIEKETAAGCVKIPLHGHTFFVENEEMMAFVSRFSPAIILPARCMTEETAVAARSAADQLPGVNRRFLGRLKPQGQPVTVPTDQETLPVLWECAFSYTPEEMLAYGRRQVLYRFGRLAPALALVALLPSLLVGFGRQEPLGAMIGYFFFFLALLTVIYLVIPWFSLKREAARVTPAQRARHLSIDRAGVRMRSDLTGEAVLLWAEEVHVYDKEPFAEFTVNKTPAFYFPKRCISDLEAFNGVINQCRNKQ